MLICSMAPFSLSNIHKDMSDVEYRRPIFNLSFSKCHLLQSFDSDGELLGSEVQIYHEETVTLHVSNLKDEVKQRWNN